MNTCVRHVVELQGIDDGGDLDLVEAHSTHLGNHLGHVDTQTPGSSDSGDDTRAGYDTRRTWAKQVYQA